MRDFLQSGKLLDVRSPKEFAHAHIPGSLNLPLFSNEERALVGTCYKQKGREAAIALGLHYVGPKLSTFVQEAKKIEAPLALYCARGGMRSSSLLWLFKLAGLRASALPGGYKKFRNWVLKELSCLRNYRVLGGFTGSGKTQVLKELKAKGEQVIDLELFANHKGSTFGHLEGQPSTEHFENRIACQLAHFDERPIWIEDESRLIGTCKIPDALFHQMRSAPLFKLERSFEERVDHLVFEYAQNPHLRAATGRLQKRLGKVRCDQILACIGKQEWNQACHLLLEYYDGTYTFGLSRKTQSIKAVACHGLSFAECATKLIHENR